MQPWKTSGLRTFGQKALGPLVPEILSRSKWGLSREHLEMLLMRMSS